MTPHSVCDLIIDGIREGGYSSPVGPLKAFAEVAQISPAQIGRIYRRQFPALPPKADEAAYRKQAKGKVYSLTRVCDTLGLDLDVCLEACGLPKDQTVIEESRRKVRDPLSDSDVELDNDDLDMLKRQIELIGPVPVHLVPKLVKKFREK
jgi:hypothetical protein